MDVLRRIGRYGDTYIWASPGAGIDIGIEVERDIYIEIAMYIDLLYEDRGYTVRFPRRRCAVYHPTASLTFSAKKVIPSLRGQRL